MPVPILFWLPKEEKSLSGILLKSENLSVFKEGPFAFFNPYLKWERCEHLTRKLSILEELKKFRSELVALKRGESW